MRRRRVLALLLILAVVGEVLFWPYAEHFFVAEGPVM
jgi:hypothetical protein